MFAKLLQMGFWSLLCKMHPYFKHRASDTRACTHIGELLVEPGANEAVAAVTSRELPIWLSRESTQEAGVEGRLYSGGVGAPEERAFGCGDTDASAGSCSGDFVGGGSVSAMAMATLALLSVL